MTVEKPSKIECSLHILDTKLGCPECGSAYAINGTIDAMSTWLEGEVPTVESIEKVLDETIESCCPKFKGAKAIHELLTRKLTGKNNGS